MLDTEAETLEWEETEIPNGQPRWNMSSVMVEAIPSWK